MDKYTKGTVLGSGTFAEVFKATNKEVGSITRMAPGKELRCYQPPPPPHADQSGKVVAIKKIRIGDSKEGVNVTALREVKLLRELSSLSCPYIITLLDVFPLKKNLALVFDLMEGDLEAIIKDRSLILSTADIKAYMKMLLTALDVCHRSFVVHRDVKPNNLLVSSSGEIKLSDFGLSRLIGSPERGSGGQRRPYTNQVFARWYRSPELLYGSTLYGFACDIWAAGCILAELLLRRPWFPGETDIDQLGKIFQALGTPSEESWPGIKLLPNYLEFQKVTPPPLKSIFPKASEDALDLLSDMVCLNPSRRITAEKALQHRFFSNDPQPTVPSKLPKIAKSGGEGAPARGGDHSSIPMVRISRPSGGEEEGKQEEPLKRSLFLLPEAVKEEQVEGDAEKDELRPTKRAHVEKAA